MKRILLAMLMLVASPALADYQLKDNAGAIITMHASCDPSSGPCAPQIGGFGFAPVQVTKAIASGGTHAAGSALGGLITVPAARTPGGTFQITAFNFTSAGGDLQTIAIRIWKKNPTSTTCTNDATFVSNEADDTYLLVAPDVFTPYAAPTNGGTDGKSYYTKTGLLWSGQNLDTTPGVNVYVCLVLTGTNTNDNGKNIYFGFVGTDD